VRSLAAILLMGLLLFNWLGYRVLDNIAENDAAHRLEARLDRQQYDAHQLILIKVPVTHLAYYNSSATFERAYGEIDLNGVPYHYVKRRIYNDTVEMLCIANQVAYKLRQFGNDYFRLVNDIGQGSKPHSHTVKSFATDPYICIGGIDVAAPQHIVVALRGSYSSHLPSCTLSADERPPAIG
jgi:hypothetical protein